MSRTFDVTARALRRSHAVSEWVVSERAGTAATVTTGYAATRHSAEILEVTGHVYRDVRRGRGGARFTIAGRRPGDAATAVEAAADRARDAVGPSWSLTPPAAPARVAVADADLGAPQGAADAIAADAAGAAKRAGLAVGSLRVTVTAAEVAVRTSRQFASRYPVTELTVDAVVSRGGVAERVHAHVRHRAALALADRLARAARRATARAEATRATAGRYDLVLSGAALTAARTGAGDRAGHARFGWLGPVIAQADAARERRGLSRYRPGQSIYPRPPEGDPITIASDGAADYAPLSAPFGDCGEPVRRFTLVDAGEARGLSLDHREAALRGVEPNGGARNLVVGPGSLAAGDVTTPGDRPVLEVAELAWLESDPHTGAFTAELGLTRLHRPGAAPIAVVGGAVRGNLFDLLSRARLATDTIATGWYRGPRALRAPDVEVI